MEFKFFTNADYKELENAVNTWLAANLSVEILAVTQSESNGDPHALSVSILYRGTGSNDEAGATPF